MNPLTVTIALAAILLFASSRNQFDNPRGWRRRRVFLFVAIGFVSLILSASEESLLISGFIYISVAGFDALIGWASSRVSQANEVTWVKEILLAMQGLKIWLKTILLKTRNFGSSFSWKLTIDSNSVTAKIAIWILQKFSNNAAFTLFAALYFTLVLLVLLIFPLALSIGLTSIVSDEGFEATLAKNFGTVFLMIHGPSFLLVWIFSIIISAFLASTFTASKGSRPLIDSVVRFSSGAGIGTAMGLILGVVSPAIWDRVHQLHALQTMVGSHPPIASDMTVTMSSLGLLAGAFFGTYSSLRATVIGFSNPFYREITVCAAVAASIAIVNYSELGSPKRMAIMISEQSDLKMETLKHIDSLALAEKAMSEMNPIDSLKLLFISGDAWHLYSFNLFGFIIWSVVILSGIHLAVGLFRNRAYFAVESLELDS